MLDEDEAQILAHCRGPRTRLYLVCEGEVDRVAGYVDATDLFQRVLRGEALGWAAIQAWSRRR